MSSVSAEDYELAQAAFKNFFSFSEKYESSFITFIILRLEIFLCVNFLKSWLRKAGKTNYQDSVNLPLWAEIQKQFRPYNPNGKDPFQSGKSLSLVRFQFFNFFIRQSGQASNGI